MTSSLMLQLKPSLKVSITQTAAKKKDYCSMESKVSMQHEYMSSLAGHVQAKALATCGKH